MSEILKWLPVQNDWEKNLAELTRMTNENAAWLLLVKLARTNLDFTNTGRLDRVAQRLLQKNILRKPRNMVRLAILGSSTVKHLVPSIRIAGLRRDLWIEVFEGDYGQYLQELLNKQSALHSFKPQFICLAFDAQHCLEIGQGSAITILDRIKTCWNLAKEAFGCTVIQQTVLPVAPDILGNNEHRLPNSDRTLIERLNSRLSEAADESGTHLLNVCKQSQIDGLRIWYDAALWLRTRQEVHPRAAPSYGDLLARLVGAERGRSAKCLVLDLDNTLWGGVIGDDGLNGIVLGAGHPDGEAFCNLQRYARALKARGVILAVCSKNDESNATAPFKSHPDMVLKVTDIACFVANWRDKATNLREIANRLNIGTDSLVFVDDNPFERNLIRQELPEVSVPELPDDPAHYVETLAAAGYFEGLKLTDEDRARADQYRANAERDELRQTATDLDSYLKSLEMVMEWKPFDEAGMQRVVQLLNKTNQFNVMTERFTENEVRLLLQDPAILTWQFRLKDKFGDNGVIELIIGRMQEGSQLEIDTWLMSCRVLGRQVEEASLNLVIEGAKRLGATRIIGKYRPTAKNAMVSDLYERLGFSLLTKDDDGASSWQMAVAPYQIKKTNIRILEIKSEGC